MKKSLQELMTTQMTRKEFLQVAGMALLSVFGAANFISYILSHRPRNDHEPATHGFGVSKFGR